MKDETKTKKQLIDELRELRRQVAAGTTTAEELARLTESQEKFAKAFLQNATPMTICTIDDGRYIDVNEALLDVMGLRREDIIGKTSAEMGFLPEAYRSTFINEFKMKGRVDHLEIPVAAKGGESKSVLFNSSRISLGGEDYLLTVVTDISDRKKAEEALMHSERLYRAIFENTGTATVVIEEDKTIRLANTEFERLTGYSKAEAEGKMKWTELIDPADLEWMLERHKIRRSDAAAAQKSYEFRLIDKAGSRKRIRLTVDMIPGTQKSIASLQDITDHKRIVEALRESKELYTRLVDTIPDIILRLDLMGHIVFVNDYALQTGGYSRTEIEGRNILAFIHPEDRARLTRNMSLMMEGRLGPQEYRIMFKDGKTAPFEANGDILRGTDGTPYGLVFVCREIAERKRMDKELILNAQRLQTLLQLGQMTEAALKEITDFALEEAVRLTQSKIGYLAFLSEDESVLTMYSWSRGAMTACAIAEKPIHYPVAEAGLWGEAVRQRRPVITNDFSEPHPGKKGYPEGHVPILRHMNVPVFDGDRIVIIAGVGNKEEEYVETEAQQLTLLMQGMWRMIERKRAAEALHGSEERYRLLFEEAIEGIFRTTLDGRPVMINAALARMLGYATPQEAVDKITDLGSQVYADPEERRALVVRLIREGKVSGSEVLFRRQDGSTLKVLLNFRLVHDQSGGPQLIEGSCIDITDRWLAEEALKASENKYRKIFEGATEGIYQTTPEGRYLSVNPAFARMFGYASPQEMTESVTDIGQLLYVNPEDREKLLRLLYERDHVEGYEIEGYRKDRSRFWISINIHTVRDASGNILYLEGTNVDITERKRAEEALQENEEKYRYLVEHAPTGIYEIDFTDLRILNVNDIMCQYTGYTREEFLAMNPLELLTEESRTILAERHTKTLAGEKVPDNVEFKVRRKDGSTFWILLNNIFSRTPDGRIYATVIAHDITARKQVEQALRESEERYKSFAEKSFTGVYVVQDGIFKFLNDTAASFARYKAEELVGKESSILVHPEDRIWIRERAKKNLANEDPSPYEFRIVTKDGRTRWIMQTITSIQYDGRDALLGNSMDITGRKQAEEERERAEYLYRTLARHAQSAVFIVQERRFCFVNPFVTVYTGYEEAELLGMDPFLLVHPDDRANARRDAVRMIKGEMSAPYEFRIVGKNGDIRWIMETNTPIDFMGKPAVLMNSMDITEHRRAEEMSRQSEDKFSKVFMTTPDGIAITKLTDGRILDVNLGFEEITGWLRSEAVGRTSRDIRFWINESDRDRMVADIQSGRGVLHREFQFRRKDETLRTGIYSARPIDIAGDACLIFILQDITDRRRLEKERRQLEKQLFQAQKMEAIGTLAGGIAHDFNNILTGIIGYTDLYKNAVRDRPKVHHGMEQVLQAANRAKDLVTQILTFSRRTDREKIPIRLAPIVKEVVKFMRASLPTTIEIKQKVEDAEGVIVADPTQMHQVLMNLCTNAGHAMKETGGVLTIELKETAMEQANLVHHPGLRPGRYLQLTVRDSGHGISREHVGRIFEPYFTTKEKGEGTGLGLAVVHGIVKDQGGEINVSSEEGHGTVFRIYLPLAEKPATDRRENAEAVLPGKGEPILFVDDEKIVADMSREMLQELGYSVVTETDPVRAVALFKEKRDAFSLVITDKTMPHMTGFDLARAVKDIRADVPVIICSGYQEKGDMEKLAECGISRMITKPVAMSVMAKTIRDVLEEKP